MNNPPSIKQKHFVILSFGTLGDIYPFINIALALQDKGHRVTFLCPSVHERYAKDAKIVCYGLGTDEQYLSVINNPDLWHSRKGVPLVLQSIGYAVEPFLETIRKLPKDHEYIVLAHPLTLPATAVARSIGIAMKIVGIYLAPSNLRSVHEPMTIGPLRVPPWIPKNIQRWIWKNIDTRIIDPAALPGLNEAREVYGLLPIERFTEHMYSIPDLSLTLFPYWFAKQQPDWPYPMFSGDFQLYDPTPNQTFSAELNSFLAMGDAPIVFTPGTGNRHAARYFRVAMEVCHRLQKRAIFLTSFHDQVPQALPDTILWQKYLSFRKLLPRVAALVHHGGIGTVAEALYAGVPQLIVPLAHDQFDNAARVQALGAGSVLIASRLRCNSLFDKLEALLSSNEIKKQCKLITEKFVQGGNIAALCKAVESI